MFTALAVVLAIGGAGLLGAYPALAIIFFVGAYYAGNCITLLDFERFSGVVFLLAIAGAAGSFLGV